MKRIDYEQLFDRLRVDPSHPDYAVRCAAIDTIRKLSEVEYAARHLPRETPKPGSAGTEHDFKIAASEVWANDRALKALDAFAAQTPLLQKAPRT